MVSDASIGSRFKRLRGFLSAVLGGLNLWAILVSLGLAPTAIAVGAFLIARATDEPGLPLTIALGVSLVANLGLVIVYLRTRKYASDLEHDMELIGRLVKQGPQVSWLPEANGSISPSNATFEDLYSDALELAASDVASDVQLGVGWIDLNGALISFNGFTTSGLKRIRLWASPNHLPALVTVERSTKSPYPIEPLHWRTDPTWADLIALSWRAERPFEGSVTLWPRFAERGEPRPGEGRWRIDYDRQVDGVRGPTVRYVLKDGKLTKL